MSSCSKERPVLLLFDGHASYFKNIYVTDLADANSVIILCFPPYSTHRMQPLDVEFIKPLNTYYTREVQKWLRLHPGSAGNLKQVFPLIGKTFDKAATFHEQKMLLRREGLGLLICKYLRIQTSLLLLSLKKLKRISVNVPLTLATNHLLSEVLVNLHSCSLLVK